ncbi:MAG: BON domain-containing protein, partial [Elusimicrobiota bacterium]|nr:BON domain-containing protein [Elusimicrobiota bacterium]
PALVLFAVFAFAQTNTQSPGGQTPSMENPGSTQSPAPTPGTEFPSKQIPTLPNQTGTAQAGGAAQRTRQQIQTDIRAAITQIPSANQQGTMPGMESTGARIQNLRVLRRAGKYVLSGTVATQAEKDAAGARATQAAGGQEVLNQLEVK